MVFDLSDSACAPGSPAGAVRREFPASRLSPRQGASTISGVLS